MSFIYPAQATPARPDDTPWLLCPRPRPQARLRLFCLPYAGRGPSLYRAWPEQFPDEVEVCLIHLPGREQRFGEPAYTALEPLLDALTPALSPWLEPPYAVYGHSMGALIGFELARRLIQQGRQVPLRLFVSGYAAPHLARPATTLHLLANDALREALRRAGGTPRELLDHPELLEMLLPMLRADVALCATYHYQEGKRLPCPISAWRGAADQQVRRQALAAWQQLTAATCTVKEFPGDHFFLHRHAASVVEAIMDDLRQSLPLQPAPVGR